MAGNSIMVIKPYRWEGMWVFDDPRVDLLREPFVAGADTMIDRAIELAGIENADQGFLMVFSQTPFPGSQVHLEWVREENGGNVYQWRDQEMEGWLCPALLKYFDRPPEHLYVELRPAES